jgi:hypothetical protein
MPDDQLITPELGTGVVEGTVKMICKRCDHGARTRPPLRLESFHRGIAHTAALCPPTPAILVASQDAVGGVTWADLHLVS